MSSPVLSARAPVPTASLPVTGRPLRALAAGTRATPGLPVGARVQLTDGPRLTGTVMSYQRVSVCRVCLVCSRCGWITPSGRPATPAT